MVPSVCCLFLALSVTMVRGDVPDDQINDNYSNRKPGCYDCNYAPSGYIKGYTDWQHDSAEVGYLRCALVSTLDKYFVYKNICRSNRCYIRREENGLVYRGCADYENLPWDVNTDVNCKYQGPSKSLWYFCDGDSCNHGQLGDSEERCGSPPAPQPELPQQQPVTDLPRYETNDYPYYYNHFQGFGPYNELGGHLVSLNLFPYFGYHSAPEHAHYEQEETDQEPEYPVITQPPHTTPKPEYNPCDGRCEHTPSGLFTDPDRPDHFIQCGCDFKGGRPCTCCKKFYLKCDPNTHFDNSAKVCVRPNKPY